MTALQAQAACAAFLGMKQTQQLVAMQKQASTLLLRLARASRNQAR